MKSAIASIVAIISVSAAIAGDWQNDGMFNGILACDQSRDKNYKMGYAEVGHDDYCIARYGRTEADSQYRRAIAARASMFNKPQSEVLYAFKGNVLNIPCIPPGSSVSIRDYMERATMPFFDSTDKCPVSYADILDDVIRIKNNGFTVLEGAYEKRCRRMTGGRMIGINENVRSTCKRLDEMSMSYAAKPFGVAIYHKNECAEELAHMFNTHIKDEGRIEMRTGKNYLDCLIWGEFLAGFSGVKADALRRGIDLGENGGFTNYYNTYVGDGTFPDVKDDLPKESYELLLAIKRAKDDAAIGVAVESQTRALTWVDSSTVAQQVL